MCIGSRKNDGVVPKDEHGLTNEAIEAEITRMLDESDDDLSELDIYISGHKRSYSGDLEDYAFRAAIRAGKTEYVDMHADDFELNDDGGSSTYLDETDDKEMQEILMDHGAFRSWDAYDGCRFAFETVNGEILAFDTDFQKEVFEKYKSKFDFTDEEILMIIAGEDTNDEIVTDVESDLEVMGISVNDGEFSFEDICGSEGYYLKELIEELGWELDFEGDSWKLETVGVYFIK